MEDQARQAVLVLGMHRSGTSAVAGAMGLVGADLPAHMLPPAADNPSGFFESVILLGVDDWILRAARCTWFDCLDFSPARLDPRAARVANALIPFSFQVEFGNAALALVKDPRLCVLLDFWLPALAALRIKPSAILVLRHPDEIMASLARRDLCPEPLAAALWLRYMLTAERATRGCPRHVLNYDDLLRDWRGCLTRAGRQASLIWPVAFDTVAPRMQQLLNGGLRHHRSQGRVAGSGLLHQLMAEAYEALLGLATGNADDTHQLRRLDAVRADFLEWCFQHGPLTVGLPSSHHLRAQRQFDLPPTWEQLALQVAQTGGYVSSAASQGSPG